MDQEKVGKFIASQRKKNNLTQEDLANRFNISCQAVSKWERGITFPDAAILIDLCKMLDVSIDELLLGEKIDNNVKVVEKEKIIVEGIGAYQKETESRLKKIFFVVIFILMCIGLILIFGLSTFYHNNYNKVKIYDVLGIADVRVEGKMIFTPVSRSLIIYNLETNLSSELKLSSLKVALEIDNEEIYSSQYFYYGEGKRLNDYIKEMTFYVSYDSDEEKALSFNNLDNLYLVIYDGDNDEEITRTRLLIKEEFFNNKIDYKLD